MPNNRAVRGKLCIFGIFGRRSFGHSKIYTSIMYDATFMSTNDVQLIVGPPQSSGGSRFGRAPRRSRSGGIPMIFIGIGFLVLFSAISVLIGNEDPRHDTDPRDQLALWARFSAR